MKYDYRFVNFTYRCCGDLWNRIAARSIRAMGKRGICETRQRGYGH